MAPLYNKQKIEERLDAVQDLMNHEHTTCRVRSNLKKLPDLEKLLAKLFTYSIKHSVDAIYFEDVSLIKLKEFKQILDCFKIL